ncbi:MAG: hypothetical protein OIF58_10150 [Cohaesibacter sp.]|nr:hypothetical protein [Cohaesibacter sp.]
MKKTLRLLSLVGGLIVSTSAFAGDLTVSAQKVEDLLASSQPVAAYDALLEMNDKVWAKLPLKIRNAQYVQEIYAFRRFKAKEQAVFKPNESHIIYAEPIGFTYGKDANGNREAGFLIDFSLSNTKGEVLLQRSDFLTLNLPLGANNKEVHLNLTVDLTGLPEGQYESHYVIKDKYSEKQDKIALPFSIAK